MNSWDDKEHLSMEFISHDIAIKCINCINRFCDVVFHFFARSVWPNSTVQAFGQQADILPFSLTL